MSEENVPKGPSMPSFPSIGPGSAWKIATVVLGIMLVASIAFTSSGITGMAIGKDAAGSKAITYINNNFEVQASLMNITEANGLYEISMRISGQPYLMYMSKDGKLLFPQVLELADAKPVTPAQTTPSVTKSDKPVVELFVMSECPYGLQAEKGIIPVANLLGDKIDFKIRYVYYAMHGEKEVYEQVRQYCIQVQESSKFMNYLSCYVEKGDYTTCLTTVNIDKTKLDACSKDTIKNYNIEADLADRGKWINGNFPPFNIDKTLNDNYGIQGSPTLVINGQQISSARDPQSILTAVCEAFNNKPTECSQTLSTVAPSAGFGGGTGSASSGSCS